MSGFITLTGTLTGCFSTGQGACSRSFLEWAVFLDLKKMVKYCSAYDCYSYCGTSGLSFHRIPKDVVRRKQWISALKLKRQLKWDCVWICSDHFTPDSYENTKHELGLHKKKRLKKNAIPTIFSYKKQEETTGRKRRIEERERKQVRILDKSFHFKNYL